MAMDYEVRQDYKELPLSELLESPVTAFQGVGDTQNEILHRFFGVETVRDLANLSYFISALGIQEQALKQESNGQRPVAEIARAEPLKFQIRPEYVDQTAKDLLASPVRVLDELTPAQALALYDAFRITNVVQLAQNRIMLESRIIEYLRKVESGEIPEADMNAQIASILLSSGGIPAPEDAARSQGEGDLRSMAGGLALHLRERLETMRQRARSAAQQIAGRPSASEEELEEEAGRVRPSARMDSRSRLDAIRESRVRADTASATTMSGRAGGDNVNAVIAARESMKSDARTRREGGTAVAGRTLPPRTSAARTFTSGTAPRTSGVSASTSTASKGPPRPLRTAPTSAEEQAKATAAAAETEARKQAVRPAGPDPRVLIAAAAVLVLLIGGIWIWLSSREEPASMTAVTEQPAEGQAGGETSTQPGAQPSTAGVTTTVETPPAVPIKAIHTVTWGQSLWRISRIHYNNPERWPAIHKANEDQIQDPDLIYPKQQLKIPEVR